MNEKAPETRAPEATLDARGRRKFQTAELSGEEVERIESGTMDPRHDHLDELLSDPAERRMNLTFEKEKAAE